MIWALLFGGLIAVFVGVNSDSPLARPDVLRERIELHVSDEERASEATNMIDAFETVLRDQLSSQNSIAETLGDELAKPSPDRETIETLLDQGQLNERETFEQILELREQLKDSVTDEEWPAVFEIAPPSGE